MVKISKILEQFKKINYILILRYLVYFLLLFLLLGSLEGCYEEIHANSPTITCDDFQVLNQNFNLPSQFTPLSMYYFKSIASNHVCICNMNSETGMVFLVFFIITYLIFKSLTDRILPPKRPLLRDSLEILLVLIFYRWQLVGFMYHQNLWHLLPAILLILFSETFYVWIIMLLRRLAIENGLTDPIKNIAISFCVVFCIGFWVVVIAKLNNLLNEKPPAEIQLDNSYSLVTKENNASSNPLQKGNQNQMPSQPHPGEE